MLKKLGIPTLALVAMLTLFSPPAANARVRVGVTVGSPYYYTYPLIQAPTCTATLTTIRIRDRFMSIQGITGIDITTGATGGS